MLSRVSMIICPAVQETLLIKINEHLKSVLIYFNFSMDILFKADSCYFCRP